VRGVILDASAILCVLLRERGADQVIAELANAHVSTVNLAEVLTRLVAGSVAVEAALAQVLRLQPVLHDFDQTLATSVAELRPATKAFGLSFGDRACLALARALNMPVLTGDRRMADSHGAVDLDIRMIR
jgi:ribonuclease VapC